jgi:GH35 family endo-1,4-beta-xylanase
MRTVFLLLSSFIIASTDANCLAQDPAAFITPAAIEARISEIRMGAIVVKTKPGAEVRIQQVRHEFPFGAAIASQVLENSPGAMSAEDRTMYLKTLSENFNYAVHENALKWYECEKEPGIIDYSAADKIWELCHQRNIPMRGHCVFWEKDEFVLPWIKQLNSDQLRAAVGRRATGVAGHFKGRISEFDLNNEMIHGDFFRRRLGFGIVNEMAWMVKATNPDATLYVNDYGILVDSGVNAGAYISQIETLLANGVPIGGIGCQGHLTTTAKNPMSPALVQRNLDRLSKFGFPIKITECLFDGIDEQARADELRKIFPIYFAHPNIEAILMWGFWEGAHWQPQTALWRKDWTPTPQGIAFRDLVYKKWWTQISGIADKNGVFKARGFYGDYVITSNGDTRKAALKKAAKALQVEFP